MEFKIYEVGGCVRDHLLNLHTKDIDYTVVPITSEKLTIDEAWYLFLSKVKEEGYDVWKEDKDCFTVRARFPKGHIHQNIDADFVLSRKEIGIHPGTRKPILEIGTLEEDLIRRDFTMNSLAFDENREVIDLYGGQTDMLNRIIRTNIDASISFRQDPLRILRAIRFAITKNMDLSEEIWSAIKLFDMEKLDVVSVDRIRDELNRCFTFDTLQTLKYLNRVQEVTPGMYNWVFANGLKLTSTTKL